MNKTALLILLVVILAVTTITFALEQYLATLTIAEPPDHKDIRGRIKVENTDEDFPDIENRVLEWYILRVENSSDYPQLTTTYWLFWKGKRLHGDIDAFAEIYNMPGNFTHYTLEITRFTCYELTVYVDNVPMITFPRIDDNSFNQTQLGYANIEITI